MNIPYVTSENGVMVSRVAVSFSPNHGYGFDDEEDMLPIKLVCRERKVRKGNVSRMSVRNES